MATSDEAVRVVDRPDDQRYEALVGSDVAGFIVYRPEPGRRVFLHTEIDDSFEGKGIGSRLAAAALDDVRARGLLVTPVCPFIAEFIRRHPAYADLVTS